MVDLVGNRAEAHAGSKSEVKEAQQQGGQQKHWVPYLRLQ